MAVKVDLSDPDDRRDSDLPSHIPDSPNDHHTDHQFQLLHGSSKSQKLLSEFSKWQKSDTLHLDPGPWTIEDSEMDHWGDLRSDRLAGYLVFGITGEEFALSRSISATILSPYNLASVLRNMAQSGMPRNQFEEAMGLVWKVRKEILSSDIPKNSAKFDGIHYPKIASLAIPAMQSLRHRLSGDALFKACYLHCWSVLLSKPDEEESLALIGRAMGLLGEHIVEIGALADIVASVPYLSGTDADIDSVIKRMNDPSRASVTSGLILNSPGDYIDAAVVFRYLDLIDEGVPADWAALTTF